MKNMDRKVFENQVFDELPETIMCSNFLGCTFNVATTFDRCNLRECSSPVVQTFIKSNVIDCTGEGLDYSVYDHSSRSSDRDLERLERPEENVEE